jgi:hypothetical protein
MCKRDNYTTCQHFARRFGELEMPITWLQKQWVDYMKNNDNLIEEGISEKTEGISENT